MGGLRGRKDVLGRMNRSEAVRCRVAITGCVRSLKKPPKLFTQREKILEISPAMILSI